MDAQKFRLKSGRHLGYRELGNPQGIPLVFFHGFPGSSVQATIIEDQSVYAPFRVIAVDRPGFGDSEYDSARTIKTFARDIGELLDSLGIEKFHVLAVSGGNPYGFACAHELTGRVLSINSVSGLGPLFEPEFLADMKYVLRMGLQVSTRTGLADRALAILWGAFTKLKRGKEAEEDAPAKMNAGLKMFLRTIPEPDRAIILNEKLRQNLRRSMRNSFRQGSAGLAMDLRLMTQDWGIDFSSLKMPIRLWHGELDTIVPNSHSSKIAKKIPHAELTLMKGEGHYSLPIMRLNLIMEPLLKKD